MTHTTLLYDPSVFGCKVTLPVVVPIKVKAKPTELGWYVLEHPHGHRDIVEVREVGELQVWFAGREEGTTVDLADMAGGVFIARVYPERVERVTYGTTQRSDHTSSVVS